MVQLKLIDYNNEDIIRPAKVHYNRKLTGSYDKLYCTGFRIQTQTFPAFIPHLIRPNEFYKMQIQGATELSTSNNIPFFIMDWGICIHDIATNKYTNMPVYWQPQENNELYPVSHPSRLEIINNPYFYAYNSLHVLQLIQNTLNEMCALLGKQGAIEIIKKEHTYQLLIKNTENMRIYFNKELAQTFFFHYTTMPVASLNSVTSLSLSASNQQNNKHFREVVFDKRNTDKYFNTTYYVSQVLNLSTRLFPFSNIQFTTSELPIENVKSTINTIIDEPNTEPIILSYMLNVTDIDAIVDNFNFNINTINHGTNVTSSNYPESFNIKAQFRTFDNYYLPLMLNKNDSLEINLVLEENNDMEY